MSNIKMNYLLKTISLLSLFSFLTPVQSQPLSIFVSILPQQTWLQHIGGEHVNVQVMVKQGYSPNTYEPLPHQMKALQQSQLYFSIGHLGFEQNWLHKIAQLNPNLKIIQTDAGLNLKTNSPETDVNHTHRHAQDPHSWLNPLFAQHMILIMRDQLSQTDPQHQSDYHRQHAQLASQLQDLHEQIDNVLKPLTQRRFMVFHPAWGYFADAYQLEQLSITPNGKGIGPKALMQVITQAKQANIKTILIQQQFSQHLANTVAKAIHGEVISVDPLAADYIANLQHVANTIARISTLPRN